MQKEGEVSFTVRTLLELEPLLMKLEPDLSHCTICNCLAVKVSSFYCFYCVELTTYQMCYSVPSARMSLAESGVIATASPKCREESQVSSAPPARTLGPTLRAILQHLRLHKARNLSLTEAAGEELECSHPATVTKIARKHAKQVFFYPLAQLSYDFSGSVPFRVNHHVFNGNKKFFHAQTRSIN